MENFISDSFGITALALFVFACVWLTFFYVLIKDTLLSNTEKNKTIGRFEVFYSIGSSITLTCIFIVYMYLAGHQ